MVSPSPASSPPVTNSTAPPPSASSPPPTSSPPTLPPPTPSSPPPPTPSASPPPPPSPSHAKPPPPPSYNHPPPHSPSSSSGGGSGNSWGINGISTRVVVGVAIAGVALLLVAMIICVCCARKKRKRRDDYGGRRSYYVPPPLPHSVPPQEGHYGVQMQHWQQNYSPRAEHYPVPPQPPSPPSTIPPRPPLRPPSPQLPPVPANFMSSRLGSCSSIASENLIPSLSPGNSLGCSSTFSYHELAMATNNFSEAYMLGQGDFGNVHKGILPDGKEIAVKSLNSGSRQGEQEFQTEVEIIGRVHHKHLVSLVGYCISGSHCFLVYQFVPNRTLEFHLHGEEQPSMDWPTRLRIALGSAKGLAYLHEDCHPKIIHGNIKSANILLNDKYEAKVADFGRAKVSPDGTHVSTRVIGTIGYLAPEYAATGKLSDKSDVFSFGVVLLELITGRPPVNSAHTYMNDSFVDWARPLLKRFLEDRKLDSLVDPRLQNKYDPSEMARMVVCAAACLRHSAQRRPRMSQVVRALEGELSLTDNSEGIRAGPSTTYTSHSSDNNEALRPRYNSVYTSHSSDNDSSPYKEDMKRVKQAAAANQADGSSEYDGTTSEYGVYPSGLSSEIQSQETTREIESRKVKDGKDGDGL